MLRWPNSLLLQGSLFDGRQHASHSGLSDCGSLRLIWDDVFPGWPPLCGLVTLAFALGLRPAERFTDGSKNLADGPESALEHQNHLSQRPVGWVNSNYTADPVAEFNAAFWVFIRAIFFSNSSGSIFRIMANIF